jgi:anti-sigma B factor antagonist
VQPDLVLRAASCPDGVVRVQLAGVIDAHTLDHFEAGLNGALEHGAKSILLDCEELRYVNSAGFGELIRYFDRIKEKGGTLVLARVPPKVGVILEMLGLKSLIPIVASLEEGAEIAAKGSEAIVPAPPPPLPPPPAPAPARTERPAVAVDERIVACAFCDIQVRVGGEGRWACPACGAPFTTTPEGGVAFDWSNADAEALHLTMEVSPRSLAALAGLIEGVLIERRVPHARMRRFAREAAHVCHLLNENAFVKSGRGPLHVLALAGPQRLNLRIVDRGRALGDEARRIFSTQAHLFLGFRYRTLYEGVNVTEFAFAYASSGVLVT